MLLPFGVIYLSGVRLPELDRLSAYSIATANSNYERMPLGILIQPGTANYLKTGPDYYDLVGIDNGCFSPEGQARFNIDSYARLINSTLNAFGEDAVMFATARDVPMNWTATLELSLPMLPMIRKLGAPAALVVQDGATVGNIPWSELDVIFIGGSTEWKLSDEALSITKAARYLGKRIHMGRVNSLIRARTALRFGCDSMDGTFLKFAGPNGVEILLDWLRDSWLRDSARRAWRYSGQIDPDDAGGDWLYAKYIESTQQLELPLT